MDLMGNPIEDELDDGKIIQMFQTNHQPNENG